MFFSIYAFMASSGFSSKSSAAGFTPEEYSTEIGVVSETLMVSFARSMAKLRSGIKDAGTFTCTLSPTAALSERVTVITTSFRSAAARPEFTLPLKWYVSTFPSVVLDLQPYTVPLYTSLDRSVTCM